MLTRITGAGNSRIDICTYPSFHETRANNVLVKDSCYGAEVLTKCANSHRIDNAGLNGSYARSIKQIGGLF